MKKIFTKLMLLAVAATALVSCVNKFDEQTPSVELTQTVTLSADKTAVRTELIEGVPYWSANDQIGVYYATGVDGEGKTTYENKAFTNDNEKATLITSFTGKTAVVNTLFVYYPYTNFSTPVTEKGVKVEILANQEPTATSFDGRSDLMIAKPVQLDAEGKQLSDLEFARVAAIVKIVLKDTTGNLAGQHVSSLTMTAATNLVGRVYLDVINQELGELYNGGAKSVNATYTEATQYEVNGTNATYVIVYPQTLAAGSTLSFKAATEGYAISKSIELGQDIVLELGKVTTLNVSLAADNLVKEETGLALPFEDDFSWVGTTSTNAFTSVTDIFPTRDGAAMYTAVATVYSEDNTALKFSSGSAAGSLTTAAIDLSQPFSVVVNAKYHGSDASSLVITVGEVTKTIALTADYADYVVEFDAASAKETITISGTAKSKRFYLNDLKIVAGHDYVLPPVLTVTKSEISVSHEAATETFIYSVANLVEGESATVTDNVDWITTLVSGTTVTVTVEANEAEEAREGVITVAYTGAESKTVTVKQAAKPAEGGSGEVVSGEGTISFANATQRLSQDSNQQTWSNDNIKFVNDKASSQNNVVSNTNPVRLYAGSKITITAPSNITKIVFVANNTTYANDLKNSIGNDATVSGSTVTATYATPIEKFEVQLAKQVRLNSLTVTYGGSSEGGNTGGGEGGETPDPTPEPEPDQPGTGTEVTTKYTFSNYSAGTQYADNEVHKLDDVLTITTTDCHFTTQLRIYSSSTYNGYAIGALTGATIKKLAFNAGYKADTLNVYGSTDGATWTLVSGVSITSTNYGDYSVDFGNTNYTHFKLDVAGSQQVRVASLTLTYVK